MVKNIEYLVFDVETTGFPKDWNAPISRLNNWPRIVQIGWLAFDRFDNLVDSKCHIIKPAGYTIPNESYKIHGISTQSALSNGEEMNHVLRNFSQLVKVSEYVIGHNLQFDEKVVRSEFLRADIDDYFNNPTRICTKEIGTDVCKIPGKYGYKWPTLDELYQHFYGEDFDGSHNALNDAKATAKCFFELKDLDIV